MAQLRLQPPEPFNFRNPDDWPRWKRHFEQFRVASGLTGDDTRKQVSTLLYCLREQSEAVLDSTTDITEETTDHKDRGRDPQVASRKPQSLQLRKRLQA